MKCNNIILSEEYGDFIGRYNGDISEALTEQAECTQVIDDSYFVHITGLICYLL